MHPQFISNNQNRGDSSTQDGRGAVLPQLVQKNSNVSQTLNNQSSINNVMHNSQNNSYASNFSRSQSRLKQNNKNIFNQFKNVVNLNGQVEKGLSSYHNIMVNNGQGNNPRPVFIGSGINTSGKGPLQQSQNMNLSGI